MLAWVVPGVAKDSTAVRRTRVGGGREISTLGNGNQRARQAFRPLALPARRADQVLAQFDSNMRQTAPLAMLRDRVVGRIAHRVGLVVPDQQTRFRAQA